MTYSALPGVLLPPIGLLLILSLVGRLVAAPLLGGGWPGRLLRAPGNLLHEGAHALTVWLCGYHVDAFHLSLTSPTGRGYVQPGRAWAPWARGWLLRLLAPLAPLPFGLAALCLLGAWVGDPPPLHRWQTWLAAWLAVSVAAEMTPSDVDRRILLRPALGLLLVALVVLTGLHLAAPGSDPWILVPLTTAANRLWTVALMALAEVGMGLALMGIPLLLLRQRP